MNNAISEQLIFTNQYRVVGVIEVIPEASQWLAKLNEAIEKAINAGDFTAALAVLKRLNNPGFKTC
ncbi:hypothetical protein IFO70_36895 [Phormidium tenue FACHB-886]|nr:hypothetical protein [Phormidium tenue FACHB-886]